MSADITTYTTGNDPTVHSVVGNLLMNRLIAIKNKIIQVKDIDSNPTTTTLNADTLQVQIPKWGEPGYQIPPWDSPERTALNALELPPINL